MFKPPFSTGAGFRNHPPYVVIGRTIWTWPGSEQTFGPQLSRDEFQPCSQASNFRVCCTLLVHWLPWPSSLLSASWTCQKCPWICRFHVIFPGFFHLRDPTSRVCRVKKDLSIRYVVMWPSRGMARFACQAQHIPAHSSSKFGCRASGNHRSTMFILMMLSINAFSINAF